MPQIIQNKSHRRRNGARPVHNIIYRVYISAVEGSVVFATRTKTHSTTKHTHTQYRRMQSVPPRRWRHAISYVLARGSMDRADRAQGIRLIAQTFSLSLSLSLASRFPPFLSLVLTLRLSPRERNFYGGNDFQFGRRPLRVSFPPFARVHPCCGLQRAQFATAAGEFVALALNTRRGNEPIRTSNKTSCCFPTEHSRDMYFPRQFLIPYL